MPQDLFPDPGPDDAEPDGFPLDEDAPGPEQGLYITLPAEHLTLTGFCQGGASDTMAPGPLLATVVHTVAGEDGSGLAGCSDDQLMGIISAARRQQSRDEWTVMAAIGEFARRAGTGVEGEFAADELAAELHMSQQSAAGQMDFATEVARRLPQIFAALGAGQIHPVHLRIIEEATRFLSDADAAKADAFLAARGPRHDVRGAALRRPQAGPETGSRHRPQAEGSRPTGGPRPPVPGRVRQRRDGRPRAALRRGPRVVAARRAAGPGPARRRRPRHPARPPRPRLPGFAARTRQPRRAGRCGPRRQRGRRPGPACPGPAAPRHRAARSRPPDTAPEAPTVPVAPGGPGPAPRPGPDAGPSLAALVTITIPLTTYQGRSDTPGEADGYGILDGDDARDLAAAAARHPRTRWCVTALNPDGTAAAHACLPGRHPPSAPGPPGTGPPGRHPPPGTAPPGTGPPGILSAPLTPITRGPCDHAHAETGYRPSRKLQHLIRARSARCTAPGCRRPAARCDLDHTVPWDQGGITCECGPRSALSSSP